MNPGNSDGLEPQHLVAYYTDPATRPSTSRLNFWSANGPSEPTCVSTPRGDRVPVSPVATPSEPARVFTPRRNPSAHRFCALSPTAFETAPGICPDSIPPRPDLRPTMACLALSDSVLPRVSPATPHLVPLLRSCHPSFGPHPTSNRKLVTSMLHTRHRTGSW